MNRYERWLREVCRVVRDECELNWTVERRGHFHVRFADTTQRSWVWHLGSTPSDQNAKQSALRELVRGLRATFGVDCLRVQDFSIQFIVSVEAAERQGKQKQEEAWAAFYERLLSLPTSESDVT
jgi:hypothetical protein